MKKEVFLAIFIGFSIGLVVTFFVYKSKIAPTLNQEIVSPLPQNGEEINNGNENGHFLELFSPLDQSIISEATAQIKGKSSPSALIVAMGEKGEKILNADSNGNFETSLLLVSGENEITLVGFDGKGSQKSATITVVYTTSEL